MRPALSVIFFTVISGAGYGLFMLLAIVGLFDQFLPARVGVPASILGLILVTLGLFSSMLHLANPKNAWRSFSRFRTSWLSREGVFAILFYFPALLYLTGWWFSGYRGSGWMILSLIVFLLAAIVVFSTGMIYACLKTIRQWNTALVPTNYLVLALMSGALLLLFLQTQLMNIPLEPLRLTVLAMLALALTMKWIYFSWADQHAGSTINTATGFTQAQVRLLDVGHTGGTFLTSEFDYRTTLTRPLKWASMLFAFIAPFILIITIPSVEYPNLACFAAVVSAGIGLFIERWLFFSQARHVVNLYHGASSV